jgi:tRNA pseudouridine55 synthase
MNKKITNGWLALDKPIGISSAAALNCIKKLYKPSKVGHAGTLDPFASGLLLVAIGEATKVMSYVLERDKKYTFTIKWGKSTDSHDCDGQIISISNSPPSYASIAEIIPSFLGRQLQVPPSFSAIKVGGKRAYLMARSGQEVELAPREIEIHSLRISGHTNEATTFEIHCSKGFYIRAIARDMLLKLGTCGHVSYLRRTAIGKYSLDSAIPLAKVEKIAHNGGRENLSQWLAPITALLDDILVVQCSRDQARDLLFGRTIDLRGKNLKSERVCVVCDEQPVAICDLKSDGMLQPIRVFNILI